MKEIIRFLLGLAAPFILIFGGAGLISVSVEYDIEMLGIVGVVVSICGLLWGCWLVFLDGSTTWWN